MIPIKILRSRLWLGVMVIAVIALGLASRKYTFLFPTFLGKYPGDALWALMIFLGWNFCNRDASISRLVVLALATSCIVEFSQLYQVPWINSIRNTTVGHLVLGSTFSWSDICAYAVGVAFGAFTSVVHQRASKSVTLLSERSPVGTNEL